MKGALIAGLALSAVASWAQTDGKARQLLLQGMGRQTAVNVRAIMSQRISYTSDVMQQIKVEISKSGKLHQLVLGPLSFQGIELVDDGVNTRTFTPDDKSLIIQPSSKSASDDVKFRMTLIERNYTLKVDRKEKIAGRTASVVMAIPKHDDLETRCYSIDDKTGFLLRLETCRDNAPPMLHFEAKMVEFPNEFPEGTFKLEASLGTSTTKRYAPTCISPKSPHLMPALGFQPAIPTSLPYGFAIQEFQTTTDSTTPALAVRLTDGLAKATVFEWQRRSSRRTAAPEGTLVANSGRLTLLVSGDLSDDVKDKLLQAFVKAVREERAFDIPVMALSWAQELQCELAVFPLDGDREVARIVFAIPQLVRI